MRIDPQNKNNDDDLSGENLIQERLATILVFAGVFGFFVKIVFL